MNPFGSSNWNETRRPRSAGVTKFWPGLGTASTLPADADDGVAGRLRVGVRMDGPGHDLESVDDARPGPGEVRGGVDREDAALPRRGRRRELRMGVQPERLL